MEREILYMLGIVAVGFAVNYTLRALPFILFAGKNRPLPKWVLRFGDFISPVIIAALIVYSYVGLEWRTAWPYVAGVLVVALQLWRKNALVSIVTGTVLYMLLLNVGCVTKDVVEFDARHPFVTLHESSVEVGGRSVKPEDVPDLLEDAGVPKDATIHIQIDEKVERDLRNARMFMAYLAMKGYRRPILVTSRHAESRNRPQQLLSPQQTKQPQIKWK